MTDAWAMAESVRTGTVSSVELVEESLRRIEEYDGQVNAFTQVLADRALSDAHEADRRRGEPLPLLGFRCR